MTIMEWHECKASQRSALRFFLVPLLCCVAVSAEATTAHGANVQRARHSRNAGGIVIVTGGLIISFWKSAP